MPNLGESLGHRLLAPACPDLDFANTSGFTRCMTKTTLYCSLTAAHRTAVRKPATATGIVAFTQPVQGFNVNVHLDFHI